MQKLAPIDLTIIVLYLIGMLAIGFFTGKGQRTDTDYFLGGRKLKWWMVGMSMVVSDIGALELIGVAGSAYVVGFSMANFDWVGCIPAMMLAAFIFVPFFWRAGIFTIPEYLGRRFNAPVRTTMAIIWGLFMCAQLGAFLYAAAVAMETLLGWPLWTSVLLTAGVVGVYTFSGGLAAVVITDAVQFVILFFGSALILGFGLYRLGGIDGLIAAVDTGAPGKEHYFHLILPGDTPHPFSWSAVLFGLALVLSPAYWIGNQAIIQRNLACGSVRDAKKSVLFGAFLKLFIPFVIVVPGMLGLALYPNLGKPDGVYPHLLATLLPDGARGIVFAAFLAALMSSVDSYLNSASTLWTMDIHKQWFRRDATPEDCYRKGRLLTGIFIVAAIPLAFVAGRFGNLFTYMQTMLSLFQGPTLAVLAAGMLWKRANGTGAAAALLAGLAASILLHVYRCDIFIAADPYLYIAWWSFVVALCAMVTGSLLSAPPADGKTRGLTFTKEDAHD